MRSVETPAVVDHPHAHRLAQHVRFEPQHACVGMLQHVRDGLEQQELQLPDGVRIEAGMQGATLLLRVIDNGKGFDAALAPRALSERAGAIGARLAVESRPGRTVVQLTFD